MTELIRMMQPPRKRYLVFYPSGLLSIMSIIGYQSLLASLPFLIGTPSYWIVNLFNLQPKMLWIIRKIGPGGPSHIMNSFEN